MRTIKSWIAHCERKHKECQINAIGISLNQEKPRLPSRVIDVGSHSGQDPPYLMVTKDTQHGFYTTLSHCWGQAIQLRTTKDSVSDHCQQILWSSLCKTYQEAITITKALKIRYLWIDSLCIIQDCADDWKHESALMAQYYGNSYCTIAADAAADGSQGCFMQHQGCIGATVPVRLRGKHSLVLTNRQRPSVVLSQDPMHQRAWCVQERLLSRRTLHFSTDQIYLECKRGLKAEDGRYYGRN